MQGLQEMSWHSLLLCAFLSAYHSNLGQVHYQFDICQILLMIDVNFSLTLLKIRLLESTVCKILIFDANTLLVLPSGAHKNRTRSLPCCCSRAFIQRPQCEHLCFQRSERKDLLRNGMIITMAQQQPLRPCLIASFSKLSGGVQKHQRQQSCTFLSIQSF